MNTIPNSLRIGTCSWKYDSWKGLVYSQDVGKNYLSEYSRYYRIVEVDQWFWSLFGNKVVMPKSEIVAEYVASVPKDFRFSIKVPNSITLTHQYGKGPLESNPYFLSPVLFGDFLGLLEPMSGQIDSLIFQFEYLNNQKMPGGQGEFQERLHHFFKACPSDNRYCIETRNKNYFNDNYFRFLNSRGLTHVFQQGYWMPSIFNLYERFRDFIQDFCVIRLHGSDRKGIEQKAKKKWDQIIDPKDTEIQNLVGMVHDLVSRKISVSLNINNHYEGSAPMTIERFVDLFLKGTFN